MVCVDVDSNSSPSSVIYLSVVFTVVVPFSDVSSIVRIVPSFNIFFSIYSEYSDGSVTVEEDFFSEFSNVSLRTFLSFVTV